MTASIDLTDQEIEELKRETKQNDLAAALRVAVDEYTRYRRRMDLIDFDGVIEFDQGAVERSDAISIADLRRQGKDREG